MTYVLTAPDSSRAYEFPQPLDRPTTWENSPFLSQSPNPGAPGKINPEDPSNAYWRLTESPMTPAYPHSGNPAHFSAPTTSIAQHPRGSAANYSYATPRDDTGWPLPPARSMSLVNVEDLPPHYQNHYQQPLPQDFKRRMTTAADMYPPSLHTSNNSSNASISESQSAPISNSFGNQPLPNFGYSPTWSAFSGHHNASMVGKGPEGFNGWYAEPPQLAQVKEEETGSHFQDPASSYSRMHSSG